MIQAVSAVRIEVMGCEDCAGLPDPPSGLKHFFPQLPLAAADSLGIAFTQDSLLQDWSMRVGICPTFTSLLPSNLNGDLAKAAFGGHWCLCCNCLMFKASHCLILLPSLPLPGLILKHSQINVLLANLLITGVAGSLPCKGGARCC